MMILTNFREKKVLDVQLEIWVYPRHDTFGETIRAEKKLPPLKLKATQLKKNVKAFLEQSCLKKMRVHAQDEAYVK
jgi:hypothetical protein